MGKKRGYHTSHTRDGRRPTILKPATGEVFEREERVEEQRKKQKLDEAERAKHDWVKSVKKKGVTCERWVRKADFTGDPFIEVNRKTRQITSTIGSKKIVVNPVSIATYLDKYQRPPTKVVTFPSPAWSHPVDEIRDALTDMPNSYNNDKFVSGKLRLTFRLINKLVHYNLNPHGLESTPSLNDGTLLFVFSRSEEKVDWAA
ncbi:hypothetical protein RHGRI_015151 [Rhododendron griersonianum]|uniref:Uncharacterized protein n=1 Tax=Rhododendron griersonianum TaxID=479676 RepID=A0AAV6KC85_9ERIC|nr:hypothetical protein RHGRI_015151 [Rhododendron griersonianum]